MNKKNIIIFIIGTFIASIFTFNFSSNFMDFLSVNFIVSAVICAVSAVTNIRYGLICGIINLIFAYTSGATCGLIVYSFIVLFGLIAGIFVKNKCNSSKLILIFSTGFLLSCIAYVAFMTLSNGTNVIEAYMSEIKPEFLDVMHQYLASSGLEDYNAVVSEFADSYFIYIQNMIPSIFVIIALSFSFLSSLIVSMILKLVRKQELFKIAFSTFMCDRITAVVFLLSGVCSLFLKSGVMQTVFMNIFVILLFVFQICGYSLIDSILKSKGMLLGVRALILLVCAMFTTSGIALIILIIAAVLDSFKNFRRIGVETDDSDKGSD